MCNERDGEASEAPDRLAKLEAKADRIEEKLTRALQLLGERAARRPDLRDE